MGMPTLTDGSPELWGPQQAAPGPPTSHFLGIHPTSSHGGEVILLPYIWED